MELLSNNESVPCPTIMRETLEPFCAECGSTNVQLAAWVTVRHDGVVEIEDYCEPGSLSEFCAECDGTGTIEWRARKPEEVE